MQDTELTKKNCAEYASTHKKAVEVLKKANGKHSYSEIARIVGIHNTTVSGLLKKAEKSGLAMKVRAGVYKKIPGILGYIPKKNNKKIITGTTVKDLTGKITRPKNLPKTRFPASLPIQPRIISSLDKMVVAYQSLYAVENSLRELIRKVFINNKNWWKNHVSTGVQSAVQKNMNEMPYHAASRDDELEYTHLGQLKEIIINGKNWNLFLPHLKTKDKNDFSATVDKAIASRNAIGHCIPLKTKDLKRVDVRLSDILEMIN